MPVFAYRGLTASGRTEHGMVDADTPRAAWQALRTRGVYPTTITGASGADHGTRVTAPELALVTRRLGNLLAAGLPLSDALAAELSVPVEFYDERLSTAVAERSLIAGGTRRDKRREKVDAVAAAVILQGWLDHQRWRRSR